VVAVYRALPSECGTALLASALERAGKTVCYPLIRGERALTFHHAGASFATGTHGIEEPTGEEIPLAAIELLVVPALAVDESGARLGRGKGYYDATLDRFRGVSVALVFDVQIVPAVPHAPHDRHVSAICSERRLLEVRA
jgi:5-formyltetrahydrofolate cyclo-ligase